MLTIRPPDPSIKGRTLAYAPYGSSEAARRYIHLAFRDAHTAIDLTAAGGGFWRRRVPPGLVVTTNNIDPSSAADLHVDFTATGLPDGAFDLVVYDPPHLADLSAESIMGSRFGSATGTIGLDRLVTAGVREAWRIASVGILVKLADSSHGGEFLQLSRWVTEQFDVQPYFVAHTTRPPLEDGKWKVQRVPRSNGAVYLVWRKDGHQHRDFDGLYERQEGRRILRLEREKAREKARLKPPRFCSRCKKAIPTERRADVRTCSTRCRQWLYDEAKRRVVDERQAADRGRFGAVGAAVAGSGVRDEGSAEMLAGGLRGRIHRGAGGDEGAEHVQAGAAGVAV
jgi:predicted nucleic acid-binding Zn ribbon protein